MSTVNKEKSERGADGSGAEVQNHLIKELLTAYQKSNSYINASRQHHTDRIKLITDWVKYPNVMVSHLPGPSSLSI